MKYDVESAIRRTGEFECAPVLMVGFNRPKRIEEQIRRISFARPKKVFFFVDGPRNEEELGQVQLTRNMVKLIDWDCDLKTNFEERNLGCGPGMSKAITWFFDNVESGIVLEDDCRPAPEFLRLASELLDRYREDDRVGIISAFNRNNLHSNPKESYHFSKDAYIWAWASWRRVWRDFDYSLERYRPDFDRMLKSHTGNARVRSFWRKCLSGNFSETTWDTQFVVMLMCTGRLAAIPRERLVANLGMADEVGAHTCGYEFYNEEFSRCGKLEFPLVHPTSVAPDTEADDKGERILVGILPRGLTYVGSKLPRVFWPAVTFIGNLFYRYFPVSFRW